MASDSRAALSLSFDDGHYSQVDIGFPILRQYGIKATFLYFLFGSRSAWKLGKGLLPMDTRSVITRLAIHAQAIFHGLRRMA